MGGVPELGAVVVGGGVAGLAAALELQRDTREVLVVDANDRPGGLLRTDHVAGFVVERGPNTVQVKAPLLGMLREHALEESLVAASPASRRCRSARTRRSRAASRGCSRTRPVT